MGDYHFRGCGERFGESETSGKSRRRRRSRSGAPAQGADPVFFPAHASPSASASVSASVPVPSQLSWRPRSSHQPFSVVLFCLALLFALAAACLNPAAVRAAETQSAESGEAAAWYAEYAAYATGQGYMNEIKPGDFGAEEPMTRAMMVSVLFRMWGGVYDKSLPPGTFSDVSGGEWFTEALSWAYDAGIIQGSDGRFEPGGTVNRETAAVMIQRASPLLNIQPESDWSFAIDYTDLEKVSEWAVDGIAYCSLCGIMSGNPDGSFTPQRLMTRAEAAAILWRIDNNLRGIEQDITDFV